jgi:Domain of unknown function (DUF1905)
MELKFKTVLSDFESNLWGYHLPVPKAIVNKCFKAGVKRFVCNINDVHSFSCAFMPMGNEEYFILMNKPTVKKLNLKLGQSLDISITEDKSEFGMPMCEELEVMLQEDPEFDTFFRALTPGTIRSLIYLVGKFKSSDLRIRSAVVIADHLKINNGRIDNKMLYEALKNK